MFIAYGTMQREAEAVQEHIASKLHLRSEIVPVSLGKVIIKYGLLTPYGDGSIWAFTQDEFAAEFPDMKKTPTVVLTGRDLHDRDYRGKRANPDDTWIYGYSGDNYSDQDNANNLSVTSPVRLKGNTSDVALQNRLPDVDENLYLLRVVTTVFHGMTGTGEHFRQMYYVNENNRCKNGKPFRMDMGENCPDPRCVNYTSIDMHAPKDPKQYLLVKSEGKGHDRIDRKAGNDEQIGRLYPTWFCPDCEESLKSGALRFDDRFERIE